jgi:AcrR family transcriptional regulator
MARKSDGKRRKEILEIARDLIFNEGLSNFTMRAVAIRAKISEAAIYKHYTNKEDLLLTLLDSLFSPWQQAFKEIDRRQIAIDAKLTKIAQTHIDFLTEKKLNPILFFSEAINPENQNLLRVLQSNLGFLNKFIKNIFDKAWQSGFFAAITDDSQAAAATACFIGLIQASIIKWTISGTARNLKEDTVRNIEFFLANLKIRSSENGK